MSNEAVIAAYEETGSTKRVGELLGINPTTAWRRLDRLGLMKKVGQVTDEQLVASYARTRSTLKTGEELGLSNTRVGQRLRALGVETQERRKWSEQEDAVLDAEYARHRNENRIEDLAQRLGRSKRAVRQRAIERGITEVGYPREWTRTWKAMTDEEIDALFDRFQESGLGVYAYCRREGLTVKHFSRVLRERMPAKYDRVVAQRGWSGTEYWDGANLEHLLVNELRRLGLSPFVSPRSLGPADLLLSAPDGQLYAVQAKKGGYLEVDDWNRLVDFSKRLGAVPLLAGLPDGENVELWRLLGRKDGAFGRPQPYERVRFLPGGELVRIEVDAETSAAA